ncbi:hypothetical protein [Egicoccus sp. AB-alg2]|uniref:hypothetical protein n=1 Tax=Egicoccus sp. AB-alg2 TaxID=3242693 RepID=UPI00359CD030
MSSPPRWEDPIGSAGEEAAIAVRRGLQVRPTLYGFEDGQPTIRVQVGFGVLHARQHEMNSLLIGPVALLGIRQVLLFSSARCTDPQVQDSDLQAALATYGITVEVAQRKGVQPVVEAYLLDQQVVDGEVRWSDPERLDDGVWSPSLRHALAQDAAMREDDPARLGTVYALSRWGVVVEVAPGWQDRYGFTRVPRNLERQVRPADRRRARDLARRRTVTTGPVARSAASRSDAPRSAASRSNASRSDASPSTIAREGRR